MNEIKKTVLSPWWLWIIAVDVFFIIITALYPHIPNSYWKFRLLAPFILAVEMNIAVWWAGLGLFVISLIAYEIFCSGNDGTRMAWLSLSVLLAGLFCDEIGSFHERIGRWSSLLYYGIVAVTLLMYSLIILYKREETRKTSFFILGGFVLFGTVAFQEKLEHTLNWPGWSVGLRVGFEEGTELMGTFLIFWGIVMQRQQGSLTSLQSAIPNLHRMRNIRSIILCGMFLHIIASVILPHIIDMSPHRGNPLALYPTALYIMLFSGSIRRCLDSGEGNKRTFALLSAFFAACSVGSMFNLFRLMPGISRIIPERFNSNFYSLHLFQMAVIVILFIRGYAVFGNMRMALPFILALFLLLGFMVKGLSMQAVELGVIAWLFAEIFLPQFLFVETVRERDPSEKKKEKGQNI